MRNTQDIFRGTVLESLPNLEFKVQVDEKMVRCYTSGKMRIHKIHVLIGDKVEVVLPPGSPVGRIVKRL